MIITDASMASKSGIMMIKEINELYRTSSVQDVPKPVIFMYSDHKFKHGKDLGIDYKVQKPVSFGQLQGALIQSGIMTNKNKGTQFKD